MCAGGYGFHGLLGKSSSDRRSTSDESGDWSSGTAGRSSISPRLVFGVAGVDPGIVAREAAKRLVIHTGRRQRLGLPPPPRHLPRVELRGGFLDGRKGLLVLRLEFAQGDAHVLQVNDEELDRFRLCDDGDVAYKNHIEST